MPRGNHDRRAGPHPVDIHVGSRIRMRRTLLGMSQEKVGEALGLTFQQVQKNERGANRVGASRLYELGRILDVPVSFFFEGAPDTDAPVQPVADDLDPLAKRETLELVRAYYRIADPRVRKRVFELTKALGSGNSRDVVDALSEAA